MIETRYSIEYIDPNPKTILSRLGKLLIYVVLTISIIAAIFALILSSLPHATSQNITVKVQDFVSSFNTTTPSIINDKTLNEKLIKQKLISSERETALKKEIEHLTQENTIQHNESVNQLKANQKLKEKLTLLSKQLKDGELKRSQLAKEVTKLNKKNKSVSAQLDEKTQAAKDYANEIKKLDQQKATIVEITTPKIIATPKLVEIKNNEENKTTLQKIAPKEKTNISQIDAIVAAMKAANKTPSKRTNK